MTLLTSYEALRLMTFWELISPRLSFISAGLKSRIHHPKRRRRLQELAQESNLLTLSKTIAGFQILGNKFNPTPCKFTCFAHALTLWQKSLCQAKTPSSVPKLARITISCSPNCPMSYNEN